jgi:hypothetical protein
MSDRISLDLDDLDDDLSQAANDFDYSLAQSLNPSGGDGVNGGGGGDESLTLESILNEEDDLENDEILKTLTNSLTLMSKSSTHDGITEEQRSASLKHSLSRASSLSNTQYQSLSDKNGIVCKQASLKKISAQLLVAIERSDAGLPTVLAVSQLFAVGTSRGLILLFDSEQILKLYITTDHKDAITALALNNR